ncbi:hypothetical protein CBR_g66760 [Chara braunii]|uniref:Uncharacterized protein n=1 Tax=Chara braunii TaxID=69332 RepID=A0A388K967_CHABU|nr:hypothetical protein CBR_g66760 [Chara braunii]|eukprot:GBG66624.1 hypothetical protein CBR_g66760 [Chara braunii]
MKAAGLDKFEKNDNEVDEGAEDDQSNPAQLLNSADGKVDGLVVYDQDDGMMTTVKTTAIASDEEWDARDDDSGEDSAGGNEACQDGQGGGAENRKKRGASSFLASGAKLSRKDESGRSARKSVPAPKKSQKKRKGKSRSGSGGHDKGGKDKAGKKKGRLLKKRDKPRGNGKNRHLLM